MKKLITITLFLFATSTFSQSSKTTAVSKSSILKMWYENPSLSKGDTTVFQSTKYVLGPNDDPAFAWSELELKANNAFDIKYWRWCPSGNYAYSGFWLTLPSSNVKLDFGKDKCKCEMQIISVSNTQLMVIIKETTN